MSYSNRFNCPLYSNSLLFQLLYQLGDRGRRINQLSYLVLVEAVYIVKANVCQGGGGISTIFVLIFLHLRHFQSNSTAVILRTKDLLMLLSRPGGSGLPCQVYCLPGMRLYQHHLCFDVPAPTSLATPWLERSYH